MKNQSELPEPKQLSSEELAEIAERVRVWHSNEGQSTRDFNALLSHIAWLEARTAPPPTQPLLAQVQELRRKYESNERDRVTKGDGSSAAYFDGKATALLEVEEMLERTPPVDQDERVAGEHLRERARDYATRAARLNSDGSDAALEIARDYRTRAEVLRECADELDTLLSIVGQPESSTAHLTKDVKQEDQDQG